MLKNAFIAVAIVTTSLVAVALNGSGTTSPDARDEPLVCPFCGGAFTFESMGVEVLRETGVRAALRSIGLRSR